MTRWIAAVVFALLPLVAEAQTVGPTVGPTCTLFWNVPTTNADGTTPLLTPIGSYRVYIAPTATPVPVPGTTVPSAIVSNGAGVPPNNWNCAGVGLGQHFAWVTDVNANGESVVSTPALPFVYSSTPPPPPPPPLPAAAPTGVRVQ